MAIKFWASGAYQPLYRASYWNGAGYDRYARATIWDGTQYRTIWERPTSVYDPFDRPNGDLGPDWAWRGVDSASIYPQVYNSSIRGILPSSGTSNYQSLAVHRTACVSDEMVIAGTSSLTVSGGTGSVNGLAGGLILKSDIGMLNAVIMCWCTNTSRNGIWTATNGTWTRRQNSAASTSGNSGQQYRFESVGNVYTAYRDDVSIATWTDSSGIVATGPGYRHCGVYAHTDRNVFGANNSGLYFDDISIYDRNQLA